MLQTFKIIRGFDDVKSNTWFNIVGSGEYRLTRLTATCRSTKSDALAIQTGIKSQSFLFVKRVMNLWNSLPGELKNARNPTMLKNIYKRWWRHCLSKNSDINSYSVNL